MANFNSPVQFAMLANLSDGIRRSTDPTGVYSSVPAFVDGMAQYGVRELSGGTYGPASGIETTAEMIPTTAGNNWGATHTGAGLSAYNGGLLIAQRKLLWNIEGHNDNGGSFNGLFSFDLTPVSGKPTGGLLLPGSLSDIDDVTAPGSAIEAYSDGRPGGRHTYKGYADDYDSSGLIYVIGGSLYSTGGKSDYIWSFDVDAGTWTQVVEHATNLGSGVVHYCITDTAARKVLIYKGDASYQFFDMATQTLGTRKIYGGTVCDLESGAGYDPTRQRAVFISDDSAKLLNWTIDWDAETVTSGTSLTFTGATAHMRRGVSVVYHPTRDTFLCVGGDIVTIGDSDTYSNLYEFDAAISNPSSVAVTTRALGSAMPVGSGMRGSWDRFGLIEDWDVLVGVTDHENGPQIISLTDRT